MCDVGQQPGPSPAGHRGDHYVRRRRGHDDLLVLTGGVGEHSWQVREALVGALAHLGLALDEGRNRDASADADISADGATARTVVVSAREDLEIRRQVLAVLGSR